MEFTCVRCFKITRNGEWVDNEPRKTTDNFKMIICPKCEEKLDKVNVKKT